MFSSRERRVCSLIISALAFRASSMAASAFARASSARRRTLSMLSGVEMSMSIAENSSWACSTCMSTSTLLIRAMNSSSSETSSSTDSSSVSDAMSSSSAVEISASEEVCSASEEICSASEEICSASEEVCSISEEESWSSDSSAEVLWGKAMMGVDAGCLSRSTAESSGVKVIFLYPGIKKRCPLDTLTLSRLSTVTTLNVPSPLILTISSPLRKASVRVSKKDLANASACFLDIPLFSESSSTIY